MAFRCRIFRVSHNPSLPVIVFNHTASSQVLSTEFDPIPSQLGRRRFNFGSPIQLQTQTQRSFFMGEANKSTSTAEEDLLLKTFFAEVSEVERDNEVIRSLSSLSLNFVIPKHRFLLMFWWCMALILVKRH